MKMNLFYLLGSMMLRQEVIMIYLAGMMVHAVMSIAFALAHVGGYQSLDLDSNLVAWGLLFGFVHYLIVGMAFGMMPMIHSLHPVGGDPGTRGLRPVLPDGHGPRVPHAPPLVWRTGRRLLRLIWRGVTTSPTGVPPTRPLVSMS